MAYVVVVVILHLWGGYHCRVVAVGMDLAHHIFVAALHPGGRKEIRRSDTEYICKLLFPFTLRSLQCSCHPKYRNVADI